MEISVQIQPIYNFKLRESIPLNIHISFPNDSDIEILCGNNNNDDILTEDILNIIDGLAMEHNLMGV